MQESDLALLSQHAAYVPAMCESSLVINADILCNVIFMADVLITFRTGVTRDRQAAIEYSATAVAAAYARGALFTDCLASLPFAQIIASMQGLPGISDRQLSRVLFMKLLRMLRLLRLGRLLRRAQRLQSARMLRGMQARAPMRATAPMPAHLATATLGPYCRRHRCGCCT